jgi:hypothetical protein
MTCKKWFGLLSKKLLSEQCTPGHYVQDQHYNEYEWNLLHTLDHEY